MTIEFKLEFISYKVICNDTELGDLYREIDGYYVWEPKLRGGFLEAWVIRMIADKLDELNAPWDAEVKAALQKPSADIRG